MRTLAPVLALVFVAWTTAAEAEVTVTIHDGRVSIAAKDATVRQILAEWARVGQTRIINAERIPGAPLTIELTDVPEQQALEILLRAVSGYLAAPRSTVVSNASVFDRIVVMPTTVAQSAPVSAPSPNTSSQPGLPPRVLDDQDEDRAFPGVPVQGRPPVFAIPPPPVNGGTQLPLPAGMPGSPTQGQVVFPGVTPQPNAGPMPAQTPIRPGAPSGPVPTGSSIPGMVVPGPTQPQPAPGLPVQVFPGQPGQPYPAQPQ